MKALISTLFMAGRSMTSSRFIHLQSNSCKCISPLINLLSASRCPFTAEVSQHDIKLGNKHRQKLAKMRQKWDYIAEEVVGLIEQLKSQNCWFNREDTLLLQGFTVNTPKGCLLTFIVY